jgi:hypothetical protein
MPRTPEQRVAWAAYMREYRARPGNERKNTESVKRWRVKKKRGLVEYLGSRCTKCGVCDLRVLQFHHRDPALKSFAISDIFYRPKDYSDEQIKAELDKCDLLCANCHITHHNTWEDV